MQPDNDTTKPVETVAQTNKLAVTKPPVCIPEAAADCGEPLTESDLSFNEELFDLLTKRFSDNFKFEHEGRYLNKMKSADGWQVTDGQFVFITHGPNRVEIYIDDIEVTYFLTTHQQLILAKKCYEIASKYSKRNSDIRYVISKLKHYNELHLSKS